jgi:hypothetical protein
MRGKLAAQHGHGYGRYIQEFLSLVNHQRERWIKKEEEAVARERQSRTENRNTSHSTPLELEIHSIQVKPSGCVVLSGSLINHLQLSKEQVPFGWVPNRSNGSGQLQGTRARIAGNTSNYPFITFNQGDQLAVFISAQVSTLMNMDSSTVLGRCIRLSREHSLLLPNASPEGPVMPSTGSFPMAPHGRRGQWIKAALVSGSSIAFVDDLVQPVQPASGTKASPFAGGGLEGFRYPMLPNRSPQRSTSPQHRGQDDDGFQFPPSQQFPQQGGPHSKPQGGTGKAFDYVVGPGPGWFVPYSVIEELIHELELEPE